MPIVEISERDFLRSKVVEPAWYRVRIDTIGSSTSSKGDSINYTLEGTIICNDDTGDTTFAGVPTPWWGFNSKAMGLMIGFLQALGLEPAPGKRFELSHAQGKEVVVNIKNDLFEDRIVNKITHQYRAVKSE
jgi:hypothetical protein